MSAVIATVQYQGAATVDLVAWRDGSEIARATLSPRQALAIGAELSQAALIALERERRRVPSDKKEVSP